MAFFSKTFDKLKGALRKTREVMFTDVRTLFVPGRQIDDQFLEELEEKFLQADMGVGNVERLLTEIRDRWRLGKIKNAQDAENVIREQMTGNWPPADRELRFAASGPTVILVAGINGAGKTTSIAKLAWLLKTQMNKRVMVCASDTFRAAAVDQLTIWAQRLGVDIVKHQMGSDPAAVARWWFCEMSMSNRQTKSSESTSRARTAAECLLRGTMLERLRAGKDVRRTRVRRIRSSLREHEYLNELKLEVAAEKLIDAIDENPR